MLQNVMKKSSLCHPPISECALCMQVCPLLSEVAAGRLDFSDLDVSKVTLHFSFHLVIVVFLGTIYVGNAYFIS